MALDEPNNAGDLSAIGSSMLLAVVDSSPDCIKLLDADGQIDYMSPNGLCAMEIDDFSAINGKPWYSLWPIESASIVSDSVERAQRGEPSHFQAFCPTGKGKPRWWDVTVAPIFDANNELEKILSVSRDITSEISGEKIQAHERELLTAIEGLTKQTHQLQQSNKDLENFAYIASHELASPLNAIGGYAQLLQRQLGDKLEPQHEEFFEFIHQGAARLKKLTGDLLDYARSSHAELKTETIDLNVITDQLVTEFSAPGMPPGTIELPEPLPSIVVDVSQFTLVLRNLLTNAFKYNESEQPTVQLTAKTNEKNNTVELRLADNGIGVTEEYRDYIFELFKRLHTRDAYTGSGLGLAATKRIIERHGGTINLEGGANDTPANEPTSGSVVVITMPLGSGSRRGLTAVA